MIFYIKIVYTKYNKTNKGEKDMASYAVKTNRRRFTITTIVGVILAIAIVASVFLLCRPNNTTPNAVIGSKIDKSLGGGRKLLNASVWDGTIATGYGGGNGTESDPYLITSAAELAYLQSQASSSHLTNYYLQTVDIDLNASNGQSWTPIGKYGSSYGTGLSLKYDGGGHTIGNVSIEPTSTYYGIFATLTCPYSGYAKGEVSNLTVVYNQQADITATILTAGGIAAVGGTFTNCAVYDFKLTNLKLSNTNYIGGICGKIEYTQDIDSCSVYNMQITNSTISTTYIGGISGGSDNTASSTNIITNCTIDNFTIENCVGVSYKSFYLGGVSGYVYGSSGYSSTISDCLVDDLYFSSVTSNKPCVGGVAGYSSDCTFTDNIVQNSTINSLYYLGGLIGFVPSDGADMTNNVISSVELVGSTLYTGGLAGYFGGGASQYNYVSAEITASKYAGVIYGYIESSVTVSQSTFIVTMACEGCGVGAYSGESNKYLTLTNSLIRINQISGTSNFSKFYTYQCKYNIITIDSSSGSNYYLTADTASTLADLQSASTYASWVDFSGIWTMESTLNDGIPFLLIHSKYMVPDTWTGTDHAGEGTLESPYIIDSEISLLSFANAYNKLNSIIKAGIYWTISVETLDLSLLDAWVPVGYNSANAFTGHLLGNRANIINLTIDENYQAVGLFGYVANEASIEWLSVYGDIDYDYATYVGGVVGHLSNKASVSNCYFEGNITGYLNSVKTRHIGGIAGYSEHNLISTSYSISTHTVNKSANEVLTSRLSQVYTVGIPAQLAPKVTQEDLEDLGFDMTENGWGDFTQTEIASANFSIKRNISGKGAILATAGGENVAFDNDDVSVNTYKKGTEVIVEATASTGYAIKTIIIGGTEYASAVNQNSIVLVYSTANVSKELPIVVVFDNQYSITISNGTHSDQGSTTVSGSNITTTNPYKALKSTSITTTSTATTNTSTLKSYITGVTIDGTLVNISSADNTTTTHTINGITYTITRTKTTGFSTQIVTKVVITCSLTKSITISTHYNAQQSVSTSVTLVGGDGTTTSTPTGTITADWGSTTNTLTKTEQTGKTFIGWVVNGQIESQEDTFSTQVTSSTTTITELWAVMYNISLTLPSGIESIQVTHMLTGLSYNITGATTLMAGDWIVKVPTGKTLKLNGTTVVPDSQGRYIVSITGNGTLALS